MTVDKSRIDKAYKDDESYGFLESYLKSIDYDFKDDNVDAEHYVSHPVRNIISGFRIVVLGPDNLCPVANVIGIFCSNFRQSEFQQNFRRLLVAILSI